jgi:CheY-like chemotaxis protein
MSVRVFLAEDSDDLAHLVMKRLGERGWTVVRAATVDEAMARLRGDRFDAIVLDYKLPGGTGLDLLAIAREAAPSTPVLFLTAHGSEEVALEAIGLGATEYMQKSGTMLAELPARLVALLARGAGERAGSRLVTVQGAHGSARARPVIDPKEAQRILQVLVQGDVLGAGIFDGAGAPIAALLPHGMDPALLGSSLLQVHAQVGVLGRLHHLGPKGYLFRVDTDAGILACTTVGGRALVAVLVKTGTTHASERLEMLAERMR